MPDILAWYLAVQAVGALAFPLTFALFRGLPDRGYAFARIIGLLLLGYGVWLAALTGVFTNTRGGLLLVLAGIAVASVLVASGRREEIRAFFRSGWRYLLLVEVMFAAVLGAAVFLRSFAPDIQGGEKPFELAFLNAIYRAETFPPPDPWLAGESISYYYGGYLSLAALTKLAGIGTNVSFFLGVSLMAALTWTALFGVAYNIIAGIRGRDRSPGPALWPRAIAFGLAAPVLVLVVSNLQGVFELLARHGVGGTGFYDALGIHGLTGPYDCAAAPGDCEEWYPTRQMWWWSATRMGSSMDIQEFPFFSLHFGDLHAHLMVMPLVAAFLGLSFQLLLRAREDPLLSDWLVRRPLRFLAVAVLLGGIAFTDAWAAPLAVGLLLAAAACAGWVRGLHAGRSLLDALAVVVPVVVAAALLYVPYYWNLESDVRGVEIVRVTADSIVPTESLATRPVRFLLFWAPLLWASLAAAGWILVRTRAETSDRGPGPLALASLAWVAPLACWVLLMIWRYGFGGLADELSERGENLITLGLLAVVLTLAAGAALRSLASARVGEGSPALSFAYVPAVVALVMLLGAELFYVDEPLGWRVNTVFRFWHQAWLLLGVSAAAGLYATTASWRRPQITVRGLPWHRATAAGFALGAAYTVLVALDPWDTLYSRWWTATPGLFLAGASAFAYMVAAALEGREARDSWPRLAWLAPASLLVAAALVYPVLVTLDRTGGFTNERTLDGLHFVSERLPFEYEAQQWLQENVEGTPVILEAFGSEYSDAGRVSSRTGLPTVIGWLGHQIQWRGLGTGPGGPDLIARPQDVRSIYTTQDVEEARALMDRYDVRYVYVGPLERETYGTDGLEKFGDFLDLVFDNVGVLIYRVPAEPLAIGAGGPQLAD